MSKTSFNRGRALSASVALAVLTAPVLANAESLSTSFKEAARTVAPSVVHIMATGRADLAGLNKRRGPAAPFGDDLFKRDRKSVV